MWPDRIVVAKFVVRFSASDFLEAPTIRLPREKYSSFAFDLLCLEDAITTRARTFAMTFSPAHSRIATPMNQPHAQAATSSSAVGRAPSYSPEDLAGFRDFANVMRDAIGGKGMKGSVKELKPSEAAARGCLGTLKSLHRRGLVTFNENLCEAAVLGGQIKVLKWLRENSCPWHAATPVGCGHLQARDEGRAPRYTEVGARKRLPVGQECMHGSGAARAPRGAAVVASERLPVDPEHVHVRGGGRRASRDRDVGERERVLGRRAHGRVGGGRNEHVRVGGAARKLGNAAVVARERVPVGRTNVRGCGGRWAPRVAAVGARERVPVGRKHVLVRGV